ncbi:hypothetical protein IMZ48_04125 [Candidatus Bathyarchaeota archaeon]|nr:hypothetical protein [Candidatus Bathyarchaeota archaeon]
MKAWGESAWTQTQRVTVQHPDGQTKTYFPKTCSDAIGPVMMKGEYISLFIIHSLLPALVPQPFGWGQFISTPGT